MNCPIHAGCTSVSGCIVFLLGSLGWHIVVDFIVDHIVMTSTLNTPAASLVADAVKDYRQKFGAEPAAFGAAPGRLG